MYSRYTINDKTTTKIIRKFLSKFFSTKFVEIIVLTTRILHNT